MSESHVPPSAPVIRRLVPLALLLCAACGGDEAPVPAPDAAALRADGPPAKAPPSTAPGATFPATAPATAPAGPSEAPRPARGETVGTWEVDPEARKAAIAGARQRIEEENARRIAALPAEKRARAVGLAEAATVLVQRAMDVLEKVEITLEVRADGTARHLTRGLGADQDVACTWVEEGEVLVLTRKGVPDDAGAEARSMRFRRVGDRLEWERPVDAGHESLGRVPITLRRR